MQHADCSGKDSVRSQRGQKVWLGPLAAPLAAGPASRPTSTALAARKAVTADVWVGALLLADVSLLLGREEA